MPGKPSLNFQAQIGSMLGQATRTVPRDKALTGMPAAGRH